MDLPEGDRKMLEHILAQNPGQLGRFEQAFLNGRRDYLNDEQKRVFASVLKTPEQAHEEVVTAQTTQGEMPVQSTQYTDEAGNAVTETVTPVVEPEAPVTSQENIVTEQTQTPASDVQETAPVEPEVPQPGGDVMSPASEPAAPVEPVAPEVTPEQPQPESPVENPYDVNTSEKDPDA